MPPALPKSLLSRIEDAGIHASAAPQQRWLDGWLMRFSPGKAKRSRCIYALAEGRWPLRDKLRSAAEAYRDAGLPTDAIPAPPGAAWRELSPEAYAMAVGELRGSPVAQRQAHAERLRAAPVPHHGVALYQDGDGLVLACGQMAREAEFVGLHDVFTHPDERGRGLATAVCRHLLARASRGARWACLQVEGDNHSARSIYTRLGFSDV